MRFSKLNFLAFCLVVIVTSTGLVFSSEHDRELAEGLARLEAVPHATSGVNVTTSEVVELQRRELAGGTSPLEPLTTEDCHFRNDDEDLEDISEFNVDKAKKLLKEGYPRIRTTENKDVVLVLGNTGSGKSTIINRLLGCQMEKVQNGAKWIAKPKSDSDVYAKMGTGWDSETLYPEVHTSRNNYSDWNYCDCPGFEDSRGKVAEVLSSIATQIAIRKAESIKAVMIVIDARSFDVNAGNSFKSLGKTLGKIFSKERLAEKAPILFVVNKDETLTPDAVMKSVGDVMKSGKNALKIDPNNAEILRMLKILRLMKPSNIKISNVFDDSRANCDEIERALSRVSANPINSEDFQFDVNDSVRVKFDEVIRRMISENMKLLNEVKDLDIKIRNLTVKIENDEKGYAFAREKLVLSDTELMNDVESLRDAVQEMEMKKELLAERRRSFHSLVKETQELQSEKDNLQRDETLVVYYKDSIEETRGWLGFVGQTVKVFEYNGIPFVDYVEVPIERFKDRISDAEKGIYKSTYESKRGEDGTSSVCIRVKRNNLPATKETIKIIEDQLSLKNEEITNLMSEIEETEERVNFLDAYRTEGIRGRREMLERERIRCETSAREGKHEIRYYHKRQYNKKVKEIRELTNKNEGGEIVYDISMVLEFEPTTNELIRKFRTEYESFSRKTPREEEEGSPSFKKMQRRQEAQSS
jgi:GTPase SAR1 family protein